MPPQRIIPLEPADGAGEPVTLTDVVLALYLEGLPRHPDEEDDEPLYQAEALRDATAAAFALGCAAGIEFPRRVPVILEQTHPGDVEQIMEECREPLAEQAADARASGEETGPERFLESLLEALEEGQAVESDVACNLLSIGFEYGCILAAVQRPAALVVRNGYNRRQAQALAAFEAGDLQEPPPGPDPRQSLQDLAKEVVSAYEKDIGFW